MTPASCTEHLVLLMAREFLLFGSKSVPIKSVVNLTLRKCALFGTPLSCKPSLIIKPEMLDFLPDDCDHTKCGWCSSMELLDAYYGEYSNKNLNTHPYCEHKECHTYLDSKTLVHMECMSKAVCVTSSSKLCNYGNIIVALVQHVSKMRDQCSHKGGDIDNNPVLQLLTHNGWDRKTYEDEKLQSMISIQLMENGKVEQYEDIFGFIFNRFVSDYFDGDRPKTSNYVVLLKLLIDIDFAMREEMEKIQKQSKRRKKLGLRIGHMVKHVDLPFPKGAATKRRKPHLVPI